MHAHTHTYTHTYIHTHTHTHSACALLYSAKTHTHKYIYILERERTPPRAHLSICQFVVLDTRCRCQYAPGLPVCQQGDAFGSTNLRNCEDLSRASYSKQMVTMASRGCSGLVSLPANSLRIIRARKDNTHGTLNLEIFYINIPHFTYSVCFVPIVINLLRKKWLQEYVSLDNEPR